MGGTSSPWFAYFRLLVVRAFLEARRHRDDLIRSVAAAHLATGGSLPCFRAGDATVMCILLSNSARKALPLAPAIFRIARPLHQHKS
eukprot:scaffold176222_cov29-Tisochrysis_lutea.AAC.11